MAMVDGSDDLDGFMAGATAVVLMVADYHMPDDMVGHNYWGADLVIEAGGHRLAVLCAHDRSVRRLTAAESKAIVALARAAAVEEIEAGVDTAVGRSLTQYRLLVLDPHGPPLVAGGTINHCAPTALPRGWSRLVLTLCGLAGATSPALAEAWARATTWAETDPR